MCVSSKISNLKNENFSSGMAHKRSVPQLKFSIFNFHKFKIPKFWVPPASQNSNFDKRIITRIVIFILFVTMTEYFDCNDDSDCDYVRHFFHFSISFIFSLFIFFHFFYLFSFFRFFLHFLFCFFSGFFFKKICFSSLFHFFDDY